MAEQTLEQTPPSGREAVDIDVAFPGETAWRQAVDQSLTPLHHQEHRLLNSPEAESASLRQIKAFLDKDLNDEDFRNQLDTLKPLLPEVFQDLKGLEQTQPHQQIDPYEHTFNTLNQLNTTELTPEERHIARVVLLYHDIGKVDDPRDKNHPRHSADLSQAYLTQMGYDQETIELINKHIRWHDLLGEIARRDGRNTLSVAEAKTLFDSQADLRLHYTIVSADVGSIPGLQKYLGNIDATYKLLQASLEAQEDFITPRQVKELPFERPELDEVATKAALYFAEHIKPVRFTDIDVRQHQQLRADTYTQEVDSQDQLEYEQALVAASLENHDSMLRLLTIMGQETNRDFVHSLEEKYQLPLDQLRLTVELFNLTYRVWETSDALWLDPETIDTEYLHRQLAEITKAAAFLENYTVEATHRTYYTYADSIAQREVIVKSVTSDEKEDYQGDGVYVGIDGSFRNWMTKNLNARDEEMDMFVFRTPLAATVPIIVSYNYPKAMTNVLCEGLDIQGHGLDQVTIPRGLVEWRQSEFNQDPISADKIRLMEEFTQGSATLVTDEEGLPALVLDTQAEPIIWGSIARALRIRRVIPKAEVSKTRLPSVQQERARLAELEHIRFDNNIIATVPEVDQEIDEEAELVRLYALVGKNTRHAYARNQKSSRQIA